MSLRGRLPSMVMYFLWYAARGAAGFFIPLYLSSIGLPLVDVGIALGFTGAGVLVFEAVWGEVIDKVGVARTLPGVVAVAVATFVLFRFVSSPIEAYAASFVLGGTSPVMVVAGRYAVVGESRSSSWSAGFGILGAVISLGFGVGSLFGGGVSSAFGYGGALYACALLTALSYPLYALKRNASPESKGLVQEPMAQTQSGGPDWRALSVLGLVSVPLFMGVAFYSGIMQLVVTQTPSIGASNDDAAVMISLIFLSSVLFQPLLGAAFGKRARRSIAAGLLLNAFVFLALTQTTAILGFDALAVMESFCFAMVSPQSLSLLMLRTQNRFAGRVLGLYGAAEDVGITLGPAIGAFVWATYGLDAAYMAMGIPLVAVLGFYLLASRLPQPGLSR